jgi:hypothetical protein
VSLLTLGRLTVQAGPVRLNRDDICAHLVASNYARSMVASEFMLMVCLPLSAAEHAQLVATTTAATP